MRWIEEDRKEIEKRSSLLDAVEKALSEETDAIEKLRVLTDYETSPYGRLGFPYRRETMAKVLEEIFQESFGFSIDGYPYRVGDGISIKYDYKARIFKILDMIQYPLMEKLDIQQHEALKVLIAVMEKTKGDMLAYHSNELKDAAHKWFLARKYYDIFDVERSKGEVISETYKRRFGSRKKRADFLDDYGKVLQRNEERQKRIAIQESEKQKMQDVTLEIVRVKYLPIFKTLRRRGFHVILPPWLHKHFNTF